ncbi:MAG: Holliday junction branch migration protein RuvA [Clostridiales bacterium]|jgi:Holliday junction DNA helicase RuvA|nr:Holliday junction branch migration protein RuvA [Clostridiales bacterium]
MYAYIKGIITDRNDQQIVIENNGIGYLINCPLGISAELGGLGEEITVYLYQSVKEDDISLYGFSSRDQKEMFLKLITVSGIGPKVAHTICASLSAEQIAAAVMSGNVALLTGVKGLGKKTAERIILELKDKLKSQLGSAASVSVKPSASVVSSAGDQGIMQDAVGALVVLGYKDQEAAEAVAAAYEDGTGLEDLIRKALKLAAGKKFS